MIKLLKTYPRTFWVANTIELFERWAWYGFFMLFANYLTGSRDLGGLEFSQTQKGLIMGIGTGILYFLPILTGAIADKFGYRRMLSLAFLIYFSAFIIIPQFSSFEAVFAIYIYLAVGAAMFKPVISATIAKTTRPDNASLGFGIFYMMVNIGAFLGPLLSLVFRAQVFYISAAMIALNFVLLLFYKNPSDPTPDLSVKQTISEIFSNIFTVLKDVRFLVFLLIISGFWAMYNQLFFTLPVFVEQWVDTSSMYQFFDRYMPFVANQYGVDGQMQAEFITNFDALYIMMFQVLVSLLVMQMKPLNSIITGIIIASIGLSISLMTQQVWFMLPALWVFGIGEMMASPKVTEYVGSIADDTKKALYMGFAYWPLFLGNIFAGVISGSVYQNLSDKHSLTIRWAEAKGLKIDPTLSHSEYFNRVAEQSNQSPKQLTQTLWETYHPSQIWMIILAIGLISALSLWGFHKFNKTNRA